MDRPIDLSNMNEVDAIVNLQVFMKNGFSFDFGAESEEINKLIITKSIAVITSHINNSISLADATDMPIGCFITDGERLKRYLDYPGSTYLANADKLILCK